MKHWKDLTYPIYQGMVHWPGQSPVKVWKPASIKEGAVSNLTEMNLTVHTGTHIDAPLHFIADGSDITAFPTELMLAEVRIFEVGGPSILLSHLENKNIQAGEILFFKTADSLEDWTSKPFNENYVYLSLEAARYLAEQGVSLIGMDYLSLGPYGKENIETHRIILGAGIWVIEGLDLRDVEPGKYQVFIAPLKIQGSDGSPVRVMIR